MEYFVTTGLSLVKLQDNVNDLIAEGWKPLGSPSQNDIVGYYQALIRKKYRTHDLFNRIFYH